MNRSKRQSHQSLVVTSSMKFHIKDVDHKSELIAGNTISPRYYFVKQGDFSVKWRNVPLFVASHCIWLYAYYWVFANKLTSMLFYCKYMPSRTGHMTGIIRSHLQFICNHKLLAYFIIIRHCVGAVFCPRYNGWSSSTLGAPII